MSEKKNEKIKIKMLTLLHFGVVAPCSGCFDFSPQNMVLKETLSVRLYLFLSGI